MSESRQPKIRERLGDRVHIAADEALQAGISGQTYITNQASCVVADTASDLSGRGGDDRARSSLPGPGDAGTANDGGMPANVEGRARTSADSPGDGDGLALAHAARARKPNPEKSAADPAHADDGEGTQIKTLKFYVEGLASRSPRGLDLEQIKASPRGEDLTKIKFARFHFNGVNTTLLDRKTKSLSTGSTGVGESPHHEDPDVKKLKAAGLLPDSTSADSAQAAGGGSKMVPVAHGGKSSGRDSSSKVAPLNVLSAECISRVGIGAVGQEYTSMLKVLGKRLDLALRQGFNSNTELANNLDIQESQHAARHRWEAVQRLSAILHEVHDAEVGLSLAEAKLQIACERNIWEEESALLASQHDAYIKKAQDELEASETRACADFSEELLMKVSSTIQKWSNASFERQAELVQVFETDMLRSEEDIMRQFNSAKVLRNIKIAAQVGSAIQNTLGDGHTPNLSSFVQTPSAQSSRSDRTTTESPCRVEGEARAGIESSGKGVSSDSVLSKASAHAAYEQGKGSLPIQFWGDDDFASSHSADSPQQASNTHAFASNAPPAEYFIPDTLVSDSATRAARQIEASQQQPRGFGFSRPFTPRAAPQRKIMESPVRFLF